LSVRWIDVVWRASPYRGERLLIHLALADYANDEGVCFPSQSTLAKKARCSENYVRLTIKQMIVDQLVVIERDGGGRGVTAIYKLLPPTVNGESVRPKTPISKRSTLLMNRNEPSTRLRNDNGSANLKPHGVERVAINLAASFIATNRTENELREAVSHLPEWAIDKAIAYYRKERR